MKDGIYIMGNKVPQALLDIFPGEPFVVKEKENEKLVYFVDPTDGIVYYLPINKRQKCDCTYVGVEVDGTIYVDMFYANSVTPLHLRNTTLKEIRKLLPYMR